MGAWSEHVIVQTYHILSCTNINVSVIGDRHPDGMGWKTNHVTVCLCYHVNVNLYMFFKIYYYPTILGAGTMLGADTGALYTLFF